MGLTNPHLPGALKKLGLRLVGWDVHGGRRRGEAPEAVAGRVAGRVRDGSVVLLHDGGADPEALAAAVRGLVRTLRERGYALVRVDELMDGGGRS
jgi:peptidoglycan/xylan/chitin deacetylase (PgdA/CDA1 family)